MSRHDHLRALATKYWISIRSTVEECRSTAEEDIYEYLTEDNPKLIEQWAAVTMIGGSSQDHFIKTFPDRQSAEKYTVEYVNDDIFAESPVAICDLDADDEPWGKLYRLVKLVPVFETGGDPDESWHKYLDDSALDED